MELKQEKISSDASICCDGLPHLSAKYPWMFVQDLEDLSHNIFYNLHDPLSQYQCRIPELVGRRIRGCFHGWLILTNHPHNNLWSLWKPSSTSNIISLPPLFLKDGDYDSIQECCLSLPPDDPTSVLLLTITDKPTFVFCQLTCKRNKKLRNKPRWTEMSYAYQLKRITGEDGSELVNLTCCNGKVYAFNIDNSFANFIIWVDIVFKDREVLIKLSLLGSCPSSVNYCSDKFYFLKGSCTELFHITLGFDVDTTDIRTLGSVDCCKLDMTSIKCEDMERFKGLDMTSMRWEELELEDLQDLNKSLQMWERMVDLKDAIFFLDFDFNHLVFYRPEIGSELGGYIHIREEKIIYSYHVKDNTVSLSSMPSLVLPTSHVSLWECRLDNDHGEAKCTDYSKQEEDEIVVRAVTDDQVGFTKSCLLNIPFDVLEMIMKYCVGVEYMNFRSVCKPCHLAAPPIQWSSKTALRRLQTYSLVSPWLMVVDENRGIFTFTDPLLGDKYFMKSSQLSIVDGVIHCSRFGWLLFESSDFNCLVFFNPFTNDLRKLPNAGYHLRSVWFSAPPTSPDCMVVGFTSIDEFNVLIHFVAQAPSWRILCLGAGPYFIRCPTFVGRNLYALCNKGELIVFKDLDQEDYSWKLVETGAPRSCCKYPAQYYLMNYDQHLLLVSVGNLGERVEVFRGNDSTGKWEKIDGLGKHMIYICGTTCLCIQAKMPEMENKIYIPRLHSKNKKIVFYSLETCKYDTLNGKNIQEHFEDFLGTTHHLCDSTWIEPSWS